MGKGNYSAISNNMKLVHWPLMGGRTAQSASRCTKVIYGYLLSVCVGVSLPTGVCMFILTYCIVCTLFAGLFT